ncbi:MAG: hypothetical protein UE068_09455 [Paludibacteraceae bacterium]|nr:hypothetical protein [Paludibacteraceae bacterium]
MKKFIYSCGILALIAELVLSCSKEDEKEPYSPQKRIAQMVLFPECNPIYKYYEYDNKGRCISSTYTYDGKVEKENYTYEENTMTKTTYSDQGDTSISIYTYNSKGYLESIKGEKEYGLFTYDNEGHLISGTIKSNMHTHTSATYEWENENVTKIKRNFKMDSVELTTTTIFEYTNYRHPTPIKNAVKLSAWESAMAFEFDPIFTNLGVYPKNLPIHAINNTFTYTEDTVTQKQSSYDIEWVLDGDQYPITINLKKGYTEETHLKAFWK